ncbi:MAG: hypothetical protein LH606_12685 [Cytophagaceae bacterium]|nr:hypothetical protein [Cytophagaceae bacterium]
MAYIKEPEGIDLIIQSEPLTDQARREISDFIKNHKAKNSQSTLQSATNLKRKQTVNG